MRPIIVHHLDHCEAALSAAHQGGASPVLMTPQGGCAYLGVGYLWAMFEAARARHPHTPFTVLLDAGDAPGHALAALRAGFRDLTLAPTSGNVADIAAQFQARLHPTPLERLNLLAARDPQDAVRVWLGVAKTGMIL